MLFATSSDSRKGLGAVAPGKMTDKLTLSLPCNPASEHGDITEPGHIPLLCKPWLCTQPLTSTHN